MNCSDCIKIYDDKRALREANRVFDNTEPVSLVTVIAVLAAIITIIAVTR